MRGPSDRSRDKLDATQRTTAAWNEHAGLLAKERGQDDSFQAVLCALHKRAVEMTMDILDFMERFIVIANDEERWQDVSIPPRDEDEPSASSQSCSLKSYERRTRRLR